MSFLMAVAIVGWVATGGVAVGQSTPSCAQKLLPCVDYLNSASPPAWCCDPLRDTVTQELDCLCNLYNTPGLFKSLGMNSTDVLTLPGRCGIPIDISACFGAIAQTTPSMPPPPAPGSARRPLKIVGGITAGVAGLVLISVILIWRKKTMNDQNMNDQNVELSFMNYGCHVPKRYNFSDIKRMTNSFKDKLGKGGYGVVYKGKLLDGQLVAVKVLSETKGNGEEFINEVASISRTSHVNVVSFLGFCYERNMRALVYEFMSNGSLDKFICNDRSCHLDCKTLYQIAIGVARGLEYLHRGCSTRIVHFDIKPQNILLDDEFSPKIADFGLAKLGQRKKSIMSMVGARGTIGYIAPEVFFRNFGGVSHKSDVYSYGMMVLEMFGGKKDIKAGRVHSSEVYFPDYIYEQLEQNEDLRLNGVTTDDEERDTARKMTIVSLWCIQTNPVDRPSMTTVVEMLEGSLQSLQIPPKPILSSPPKLEEDSSPLLPQSSSTNFSNSLEE